MCIRDRIITLPEKDNELLWKKLLKYISQNCLMGCSNADSRLGVEEELPLGILTNHAYSIIDCQEIKGNKLMRIRNPWGSKEWSGRWSDGSAEWTPELLKHFNYEFHDDGTFFMCFEDFITQFNKLYILRMLTGDRSWYRSCFPGEWKRETAGGCMNNPTWPYNPQFALETSEENTTVFISLLQDDVRGMMGRPKEGIGFYLLKSNDLEYKKLHREDGDMVAKTEFAPQREVSMETILVKPTKAVIIPATFHPNKEQGFFLSVYSNKPISVRPITSNWKISSFKGKWKGETAAGSKQMLKNPQILVKSDIKGKDTFVVSLQQNVNLKGGENPFYISVYVFPANPQKGN
eukprot:TRINITY_DN2744_c0_g1_i1.p1 TRINITY_DN2744_c0_g1~~TRINITY_DN2744_c0_g1_i1.p1  ORF type:complete len:348 (+),score=98.62 TRINITY_DN2744_c0_g1_i1:53-1096(+)